MSRHAEEPADKRDRCATKQ